MMADDVMSRRDERKHKKERGKKCFVNKCNNHSKQGYFVNGMCFPCYETTQSLKNKNSQLYRNFRTHFAAQLLQGEKIS